jgi:hypothetical protein
MSRAKICAPLVVFLLCFQPFSYSQKTIVNPGQTVLSADPVLDAYGNLLFFKTVLSKTAGVETDVTLVSPEAKTTTETYPGVLSSIKRGEQAIYALEAVPGASRAASSSASLSLVALVTSSKGLPVSLVEYPLKGSIDLLKIDRGTASDVIYLVQKASSGRSVLILTFNGVAFNLVGTVPLS